MAGLVSLEDIQSLYAARGSRRYGEDIAQIEHALQCAALAEAEGAAPSMVVAALLHDIGRLLEDSADVETDAAHDRVGAAALGALFGAAVCEPIALHVAAKRYLCAKNPLYLAALSPTSQASLRLQGGPFDAQEAAAFETAPYWREALALRRFDDLGKQDEPVRRSFDDFVSLMRSLLT